MITNDTRERMVSLDDKLFKAREEMDALWAELIKLEARKADKMKPQDRSNLGRLLLDLTKAQTRVVRMCGYIDHYPIEIRRDINLEVDRLTKARDEIEDQIIALVDSLVKGEQT